MARIDAATVASGKDQNELKVLNEIPPELSFDNQIWYTDLGSYIPSITPQILATY